MWWIYAFLSALFLGLYDVCKKHALKDNAVLKVLFLNTLFCSCIFLPLVLSSAFGWLGDTSMLYVPVQGWDVQKYVVLKSVIVLGSWVCGYYGIKHLPLTLVGPINATRPVMVLLGALLIFGEHLNFYQWIGVALAIFGFYLLSCSGKKEGIDFRHNHWVLLIVLAAILGAISGLYDKYLIAPVSNGGVGLNRMVIQSYFCFYQCLIMGLFLLLRLPGSRKPFHWDGCIVLVSLFLSIADFVYFYSLSLDGAMISVISMIRRGSVVVSFFVGGFVFHEKNLRNKSIDLALVLLSMFFLYIGSK